MKKIVESSVALRSWKPLPPYLAIPAMAVTVLVMAYSGYFSPWSILIFYMLWLPWAFVKGASILLPPKGSLLAFAYIGFATLSVLWSDYLSDSLRAALEYASMAACIFVILRIVPIESYVRGMILGIVLALLLSIETHNYVIDPFSNTATLVGLFGSKNQLGFFAELGIYLTIVFWFGKQSRFSRLIYVPIPFLISAYCLRASHSASAIASLAVALATLGGVYIVSRLPRRIRRISLITALFFTGVFILIAAGIGLQESIFGLFGKDATLSGRTYLWQQGYKFGLRHPFTGTGYSAFWVPGRMEAEHLWYEFGVINRTGFHFHNTFVESFVELGLPGMMIVFLLFVISLLKSLNAAVTNPLTLEILMPVGLCAMLLMRAMVEVDVLWPFQIGALVLIPILPSLKIIELRQHLTTRKISDPTIKASTIPRP